jgi:hypothetical protein
MRRSFKCLSFYFIVSTCLFNIYIFYQLHIQREDSNEHQQPRFHGFFNSIIKKKNNNEFLVLDWTANQHIFQEKDPIECKLYLFRSNIFKKTVTIK